MNLTELSTRYTVRRLDEEDVDRIYELSVENLLFYQYCPPFVTKESILADQKALPPGRTDEDKFYIGFFRQHKLMAVMDLILGYPNRDTAFIGLFMMAKGEQGKGNGSHIVNECFRCLQSQGYRFVRLGFAKGNPQSEGVWTKNGFIKLGIEVDNGDYTVVVMQKSLQRGQDADL